MYKPKEKSVEETANATGPSENVLVQNVVQEVTEVVEKVAPVQEIVETSTVNVEHNHAKSTHGEGEHKHKQKKHHKEEHRAKQTTNPKESQESEP